MSGVPTKYKKALKSAGTTGKSQAKFILNAYYFSETFTFDIKI